MINDYWVDGGFCGPPLNKFGTERLTDGRRKMED